MPDSARTVVDPNVLDPSGSTTIDFYEPSLDGKLVAVSLSKGGTRRWVGVGLRSGHR